MKAWLRRTSVWWSGLICIISVGRAKPTRSADPPSVPLRRPLRTLNRVVPQRRISFSCIAVFIYFVFHFNCFPQSWFGFLTRVRTLIFRTAPNIRHFRISGMWGVERAPAETGSWAAIWGVVVCIGGHAVIIIMKSWTEEVPPRSIRGRVSPWDDYNSKWNCDGPKIIMIVTKELN